MLNIKVKVREQPWSRELEHKVMGSEQKKAIGDVKKSSQS